MLFGGFINLFHCMSRSLDIEFHKMKLYKPILFLKLNKSLLLRERKLINILLSQLCQHLLSLEKTIIINSKSIYQITLNASYVHLLLRAANTNTRVDLETIINEINNKNICIEDENNELGHALINQLTLNDLELTFSINPALNKNCKAQRVFAIDEDTHNKIKKKNTLIIYELCIWKTSLTSQEKIRKSQFANGEEIFFVIDIPELKAYFGTDTYRKIPTGQFSRSVLKPAIDYLNTVNPGFSVRLVPHKESKVITHYYFYMKVDNASQLNTLLFS